MAREDNILIFQDTEKECKNNKRLQEATKRAIEQQKVILENDVLEKIVYDKYEENAKVVISKKRTFEAAVAYKGQKIAIHNFASASNPGGGVENGASAQEECLCRCSNLYFCLKEKVLWEKFYKPHRNAHNPINNDDIIYTPSVTVFKTDTAMPTLMSEKDWYDVDVITCAAPNLREKPSNRYNTGDGNKSVAMKDSELLILHEKRLRRILDVAVLEDAEVIILGAFGCGAFMNNPEVVARAAKNVIKDYLKAFKKIEFAVYCSPRDDRNYKVFERVVKL